MSQSRPCKTLPGVVAGAALLLIAAFYLASRFTGPPASERGTPVRSRPSVDVAVPAESLLTVPTLGTSTVQEERSEEAYVALQYGGFFLSLRVLGQSLRESGTTRDMIALCMSDVPDYQKEILRKEGWIIRSLDPLPKSCVGDHVYSRHFTKVQAWLLKEYRRVILIDSDAIVLHNIDQLFACGEFCAAYRHSDLFNTGVVVLQPSEDTFRSICSKIQSIRSFTNGDQGFLNYFYEDLKKARMFSPADDVVSDGEREKFQRLPAEYNGDVSVYYLTNQWMYLDTNEPYVLHYTLGPIKPWKWWSYPLFSLNWRWKSLRDRLPVTQLHEPSLLDWASWLPLALLLACLVTSRLWLGHYTIFISKNPLLRGVTSTLSPVGHYTMKLVPVSLLLAASYWSFSFVPETLSPFQAWMRYGLWILLFFSVPFFLYCHLAYVVGTQQPGTADSQPAHPPSFTRPWRIASEALIWLVATWTIFCLTFWVPVAQTTMKHRALFFFGLILLNFVLCYWCGRRTVRQLHSLGLRSAGH